MSTFYYYYFFLVFYFLILKSLIPTCVPKHESPSHLPYVHFLKHYFKKIFTYLAVLGLSCGTWDLQSSLQHVGSFLALACGFLAVMCEL